jgi:hypothetical protein
MPRFFKSLVPALLAISLIMQGVFLLLLQAPPVNPVTEPDEITSLFDVIKHDSKKSQHEERSCNADDQDEGQSGEKENVSWQLDFCGVFYHPLALSSFSKLFPVESIHRLMSPVSGIFRPPRA